jgi:hypothetical protein
MRLMKTRLPIVLSITALVIAVLGATPYAEGHGVVHALFAHNAGRVDGKNAVGAEATLREARGKLVATQRRGAEAGKISKRFLPKVDVATFANHANTAGRAASAADADTVDGLDSEAFAKRLWAVVTIGGGLFRSSGAVSTTHDVTGTYTVRFNRSVRDCAWIATIGRTEEGPIPDPGTIRLNGLPFLPGLFDDETVVVRTTDLSGADSDRPFSLSVVC